MRRDHLIPQMQTDQLARFINDWNLLNPVDRHQAHDEIVRHRGRQNQRIAMNHLADRIGKRQPAQQATADVTIGDRTG